MKGLSQRSTTCDRRIFLAFAQIQQVLSLCNQAGGSSVRKIAAQFEVTKAFVQKMLKQQVEGHLNPRKQGGGMKRELAGCEAQLALIVEQHPDATLSEYCEYWGTDPATI
ncbi:hypothetical protein ACJ2PR_26110 [Phormidesmis sp. 146-33]